MGFLAGFGQGYGERMHEKNVRNMAFEAERRKNIMDMMGSMANNENLPDDMRQQAINFRIQYANRPFNKPVKDLDEQTAGYFGKLNSAVQQPPLQIPQLTINPTAGTGAPAQNLVPLGQQPPSIPDNISPQDLAKLPGVANLPPDNRAVQGIIGQGLQQGQTLPAQSIPQAPISMLQQGRMQHVQHALDALKQELEMRTGAQVEEQKQLMGMQSEQAQRIAENRINALRQDPTFQQLPPNVQGLVLSEIRSGQNLSGMAGMFTPRPVQGFISGEDAKNRGITTDALGGPIDTSKHYSMQEIPGAPPGQGLRLFPEAARIEWGKITEDPNHPGSYIEQGIDPFSGQVVTTRPAAPPGDFEKYYKDWLESKGVKSTPQNRMAARREWAAASQAPQRPPQVLFVNPSDNTVGVARPGTALPEGARTVQQQGTQNVPTTQMRNVGAQALTAHEGVPALISDIDRMRDKLGPLSGRWNEFMQGKVGMDDPELAGLRADLLMQSSAIALMHARGRLPENLRKEFDDAINSPKQTADNLISTLQHIDKWTVRNMNTMKGGGPTPTGTSAAPPNVQELRKKYNY